MGRQRPTLLGGDAADRVSTAAAQRAFGVARRGCTSAVGGLTGCAEEQRTRKSLPFGIPQVALLRGATGSCSNVALIPVLQEVVRCEETYGQQTRTGDAAGEQASAPQADGKEEILHACRMVR